MSVFGRSKNFELLAGKNEEWFEVHSSAVTNTNPGSMVYVTIDTTPTCSNMTDSEFRQTVMALRDDAVEIIGQRLRELKTWKLPAQERVEIWFGTSNEATRAKLIDGLTALVAVMNGLTGTNFVRPDSYMDVATGCVPNRKNLNGEAAHVCRPDTSTHTIAIRENFCALPNKSAATLDSKQLTIVHECTHFIDTFGSVDYKNTYGQFLGKRLAKEEPDMAVQNADNIAWYILCVD
ncbi:M35 family metallo-endopeptidase [Paraburkholderia sp. J63]|uniref:M35 family metallo-endopeptidase n=1 Tax=Paraburkholderia sp. J63 TaxID=2805434 RepID=UPI002ABE8A40|nr:M35 family metallo-endopeptidase [Paraburkholderia sp. J63]